MKTTFHPYGERALLINWEQSIAPEINQAVVQLNQVIVDARIDGLAFCIPAYCSLTIGFHPEKITYYALCERISRLLEQVPENALEPQLEKKWIIPVCYEEPYAPDLEWLSQHCGLEKEQIIHIHTNTIFRVYMLGFMPGFPYMGTLPQVLEAPRKNAPRVRIPAGAVAVAGLQTGIYPIESPGGWQIIGRTPWEIFDPERATPFLLQAGDQVQFEAIDEKAFQNMEK